MANLVKIWFPAHGRIALKSIALGKTLVISGANRQEAAETLALKVLTWLATDDELFAVFLGATGAAAPDIATSAAQPEFLGAVLDFVLMDDAWVTAFCDAAQVPYTAVMAARQALPGGEQVNWT